MKKNEEIRMAAHEMKNAITSIHGYSELIKYGIIEGEELKTTSVKMEAALNKMDKMIDDLVLIYSIDEEYQGEREDVSLYKVASDAVEQIKRETYNIELADIDVTGDAIVNGDRELLYKMIIHIMRNSLIYNDNEKKRILVEISTDGNKVCLAVKDNGMGIREEDREKVFECFYRVNKILSRDNGGNGLGLTVCRKIAEYHGGVISIKGYEDNTEGCIVNVEF